MAWRGIRTLSYGKETKQKIIRICPNAAAPSRPVWVNTTQIDMYDSKPSALWRKLQNGKDIKEILDVMKNISLIPVDTFVSNKNIVKVSDLYDVDGEKYCVFSTQNKMSSLLVTSTKTAKEMTVCGYTKKKESYMPLLLVVKDKKISVLNSL
jgi:hypothetical protein